MKQISATLIFFLMLISFNNVIGQPKQISFCEGMKLVQKTFQDGKKDELKGTVTAYNKYSFNSTLDIDDITEEAVGTNLGTYYWATYRSTTTEAEQKKTIDELVDKLEHCFNKKAKKSEINGYKLKVGKVIFSALYLGSRAIVLSISDEE